VHMNGIVGSALLYGCLAASAQGGEAAVKLASGAQTALVQLRCSTCHSLDYIVMNSSFLARSGWEAEVRKMMKVMGAPIAENEVAPIVDYLAQYYGAK
jgi:sulfite dehydrogenase (cytochrome) subunit B